MLLVGISNVKGEVSPTFAEKRLMLLINVESTKGVFKPGNIASIEVSERASDRRLESVVPLTKVSILSFPM